MNETILKAASVLAKHMEEVRIQNEFNALLRVRASYIFEKKEETNEEKRLRKIRERKLEASYREYKINELKKSGKLNYKILEENGAFSVVTEYCYICGGTADKIEFKTYHKAFRYAAHRTLNGWNPYRYGKCEEHYSSGDIFDSLAVPCDCGGQKIPMTYDDPYGVMFCKNCSSQY